MWSNYTVTIGSVDVLWSWEIEMREDSWCRDPNESCGWGKDKSIRRGWEQDDVVLMEGGMAVRVGVVMCKGDNNEVL